MNEQDLKIVLDLSEAYEAQIEQLRSMLEAGKDWLSSNSNADKSLLLHQLVKSQLNLIRSRLKQALSDQADLESDFIPEHLHSTIEEANELILDLESAIQIKKSGLTMDASSKKILQKDLAIWFRDQKGSTVGWVQSLSKRIEDRFQVLQDL